MHFCADEFLMLSSMIPFIGIYFYKLHAWYHAKFKHKCHTKSCDETHVEHSDEKND